MKRNGIQGKLTRTFSAVIVSTLLITNVLTGFYLYRLHRQELIDNYQSIGENSAKQMERDLSTIENFARLVCFDTSLQNLMRTHLQKQGYAYYRTIREIVSSLSQYAMLRDDLVDDIYIVDTESNIISRNGFYADTLESRWYQDFLASNTNFYFSTVHEVEGRNANSPLNRNKVVSCVVSMYDLQAPTHPDSHLGYVIVNIKYDALTNMMNNSENLQYVIIQKDGMFIDETADTTLFQQKITLDEQTAMKLESNYIFSYFQLPLANWVLVTSTEVSAINVQFLYVAAAFAAAMLFIMYFAGRIVAMLARKITEPLKVLTAGIQQFSTGDFGTRVTIQSGDEVEEISLVFNEMVDKIKGQMDENLRKEHAKRKSEMRFLMAQIKPHFIYNSLNCIIYLARSNKNEDIIRFTRTFISLLQTAIKTEPQELVPLFTEIEYLNNYVTLLGYRYDYVPAFSWDVEEECYDLCLPSLILLPLVENSIFHGFISMTMSGHIYLSVKKEEERVKIILQDDGCGIQDSVLEEIRSSLYQEESSSHSEEHIGLYNVNERLKLCFGKDSVLHIDSTAGKGTIVWFYADLSTCSMLE
jgi:two-component system sensor histidine kinase YesM